MNAVRAFWLALFVSPLLGVAAATVRAQKVDDVSSAYIGRALNSLKLSPGDACPVSTGDNSIVSSHHGYIFGAGGYFFGSGPVYLALSWKPSDRPEAYFELDPRTLTAEGYRLKTPWIMHPECKGRALIRGAQIGTDFTHEILFHENTHAESITANMILRSEQVGTRISDEQRNAVDAVWGFWPSSMFLSKPGCYAIQIDTEHGSDIVVFEAIAQE